MFACAEPQTANPFAVDVGAKPPWNQPQVTPAAFSLSPMFGPVRTPSPAVLVWLPSGAVVEGRVEVAHHRAFHGSSSYSASRSPTDQETVAPVCGLTARALLVSPETRFSIPGVSLPKVVVKDSSPSAKCCA